MSIKQQQLGDFTCKAGEAGCSGLGYFVLLLQEALPTLRGWIETSHGKT
jgi:hypothetical protein